MKLVVDDTDGSGVIRILILIPGHHEGWGREGAVESVGLLWSPAGYKVQSFVTPRPEKSTQICIMMSYSHLI